MMTTSPLIESCARVLLVEATQKPISLNDPKVLELRKKIDAAKKKNKAARLAHSKAKGSVEVNRTGDEMVDSLDEYLKLSDEYLALINRHDPSFKPASV